ncbi:hypothetical protein C8F04DRAFT_695384 [Mycena alexandri]|uniref:Uncharacterized protein n=1 Tax=Mycena alexandri TaxID=1745969 RepID=A0AAD6WY32_9AGAR|nr:hypothetical protein C8F04DRAFT_695384 [Mycena alexandri]
MLTQIVHNVRRHQTAAWASLFAFRNTPRSIMIVGHASVIVFGSRACSRSTGRRTLWPPWRGAKRPIDRDESRTTSMPSTAVPRDAGIFDPRPRLRTTQSADGRTRCEPPCHLWVYGEVQEFVVRLQLEVCIYFISRCRDALISCLYFDPPYLDPAPRVPRACHPRLPRLLAQLLPQYIEYLWRSRRVTVDNHIDGDRGGAGSEAGDGVELSGRTTLPPDEYGNVYTADGILFFDRDSHFATTGSTVPPPEATAGVILVRRFRCRWISTRPLLRALLLSQTAALERIKRFLFAR